MRKEKTINPPSPEAEKELSDIVNDVKTEVRVRNTTFHVGGIFNDTLDKITRILVDADAETRKDDASDMDEDVRDRRRRVRDRRITAQCAAAAVLNGYFKIRLFWWLVWRWFYYAKQFTDAELTPLIVEIKKKADSERTAYFVNTTLLTDTRMTTMTMTRKEANRIRQELLTDGVGRQQSPRRAASSSPTSPIQDTSSSDSSRSSSGDGGAD